MKKLVRQKRALYVLKKTAQTVQLSIAYREQYGGWITSEIVGPFKVGAGTHGW